MSDTADLNLELKTRINKIDAVFGVNSIVARRIKVASIAGYYNRNRLVYRFFHNRGGFVHIGIAKYMILIVQK